MLCGAFMKTYMDIYYLFDLSSSSLRVVSGSVGISFHVK